MAFIVGAIFLNMSFILAEVAMLNIDAKNNTVIQNLAKNGIEEEKETNGESPESDEKAKETDLSIEHTLLHHGIVFIIGQQRDKDFYNPAVSTGFTESFFTPPERI
jgi:hypothetical protein